MIGSEVEVEVDAALEGLSFSCIRVLVRVGIGVLSPDEDQRIEWSRSWFVGVFVESRKGMFSWEMLDCTG